MSRKYLCLALARKEEKRGGPPLIGSRVSSQSDNTTYLPFALRIGHRFSIEKKKKKETFSLCRILSNRRIFFSLSLSLFLDGINVIRRRSYKLSSIRKKRREVTNKLYLENFVQQALECRRITRSGTMVATFGLLLAVSQHNSAKSISSNERRVPILMSFHDHQRPIYTPKRRRSKRRLSPLSSLPSRTLPPRWKAPRRDERGYGGSRGTKKKGGEGGWYKRLDTPL